MYRIILGFDLLSAHVPRLGPAQASFGLVRDDLEAGVDTSSSSSYNLHEFDFLDEPVMVGVSRDTPRVDDSDSDVGSDWSDIGDDWPDASVDQI